MPLSQGRSTIAHPSLCILSHGGIKIDTKDLACQRTDDIPGYFAKQDHLDYNFVEEHPSFSQPTLNLWLDRTASQLPKARWMLMFRS